MNLRKPPDKYKTLKISLKKIINKNVDYSQLQSAVIRVHKLTILVYQFLRAYVLYLYNDNKEITEIDNTFITMTFKVLMVDSKGPKPKGDVHDTYVNLLKYYNDNFKNLTDGVKIDGKNLSEIISYSATDMLTNIENNIKCHFRNYLNKFVNESFKEDNLKILNKLSGKEKTIKQKEINKELWQVKEDLFNGTLVSDKKYHTWIEETKSKILPTEIDDHQCEINVNPQKYLKYMINMNKLLEDKNLKQFQFFPLRTNCVPKYIQLGTKSLIEIFVKSDKNKYLLDIPAYKDELWRKYFNLNNKIFKVKHHSFDYSISTDGVAVSIRFIHDDYIEKENEIKQIMKQARRETREENKGLTEAEKKKKKDDKKAKNKEKQKIKQKEYQKKKRELKKQLKEKNKNGSDIDNSKYIEFQYFDKLTVEETETLKKANIVYNDSGMRKLLYMMNNENKYFVYSNQQRIAETKRNKYQQLRENRKEKTTVENEKNIIETEEELSGFNSKSCDYNKFKEYVKKKNEINIKLFNFYEQTFFRKLNWFSYMNTKRSEDNLLNKIEEVYGKEPVIIYGDWNQSGKVNYTSTAGIKLKRKIAERFKVYSIDEFRTSCLNYKTEEKSKNLYLPTGKDKQLRKIHSILTYKMENKRQGCINRDRNAVLNMRKIVQHYFKTGERPYRYRRGVELEESSIKKQNKVYNPEKSVSNVVHADLIIS